MIMFTPQSVFAMVPGSNYLHLGDELGDDGEHRVTETVRFETRL